MPCRRLVLDDVEEEENLLDFICVTIVREANDFHQVKVGVSWP
jgi:hypothetical protein